METLEDGQMTKEELTMQSRYAAVIRQIRAGEIPNEASIDLLVKAAHDFGKAGGQLGATEAKRANA